MKTPGSGYRIGLPRALAHYLFPAFWETFFEQIGLEVRISPATNAGTIEEADVISEPEHCLPVKLFDAHVAALLGQVDAVFVPRILSTIPGRISCPKLSALPDAIRAQFGRKVKTISPEIDENRRPLSETLKLLGVEFGSGDELLSRAVESAFSAMAAARREQARPLPGRGRPYLMLGHPYNLCDPFLSGPVRQKMKALGVSLEFVDYSPAPAGGGPIRWDTASRMYERVEELCRERCAGIIQLSSFNCGCDSIVGTFLQDLLKEKRIPCLTLVLDGHTATTGLETRLEAFVESVEAAR